MTPHKPNRSRRDTPAKQEAQERRLAEKKEKQQTLSDLLGRKASGEEMSKKDEKKLAKLQKELKTDSFDDVSQAEDIEMSGMAPAPPDMDSHGNTVHAETVKDSETPGSKTTEPSVVPQTKPPYPEPDTDDSLESGQNLPAKSREFRATSFSAEANTEAGNTQQEMTSANKSKLFQQLRKENVEVVEEGYLIAGYTVWMVYGHGLPSAAKYEMEALEYDNDEELKEHQRLSSTEKRISILKKENGRRQYNYDNIESIDAVTVLPYGRRNGKRRPRDDKYKQSKPKKPRFRLTLVQVKWRNILPTHEDMLKEGRTWEPRSELLSMVGQKYKVQLDLQIFEMCETQDSRNALWMEKNGKAHLTRPKTPLPGNIELVSARAARQKSSSKRCSVPSQTRTNNGRNGTEDKGKDQEEEGESEDEDDESEDEEGKRERQPLQGGNANSKKKSVKGSRARIQNAEGGKAPEPVKFSQMTYTIYMMELDKIPASDVDKDEHAENRARWERDWPTYKQNMLDAGHQLVEF
ncbi:hypothetical protein N7537_010380 [Penicillium hordei]|uniref:Uncharacterized protein n=1 Tax=Penicillium hordei TaxID=40994 RepID=A0AAD6GVL9_9EURO|nr:uncharacterized protein N7537_010380 [Penicillium hordei]KAJ5593476.1 hypothetical protein N7537_010380 [Penicillium hordei]